MPGKGAHQVVEFYARASYAATPDMWTDKLVGQSRDGFAFLLEGHLNEIGYPAVCTPGSVKGYDYALKHIRHDGLAGRDGAGHSPGAARSWCARTCIGIGRWTRRAPARSTRSTSCASRKPAATFISAGRRPQAAGRRRSQSRPRPHARAARGGVPDLFYHGELAEEIAGDMAENGGLISREDLSRYELSVIEPLRGSYRGHRIATTPPPGSGLSMLQVLHVMEHFDVGALRHGSPSMCAFAEAMKRMTNDKDTYMGDPAYVHVPVERLVSKTYAAERAAEIARGERAMVTRLDRLARHDPYLGGRRPRQRGRAHPFPRQPVGRDHRRARLHV